MRRFVVLWLGQSVALVGSEMAGFALGVWVFQQSGSVTKFAVTMLTTVMPGVVIAPFAGAAVDRYDRRHILMASTGAISIVMLLLALLAAEGRLQVWLIWMATFAQSTLATFQTTALLTAMPLLMPADRLKRANGMMQLGQAVARTASPLAAGILLPIVPLPRILLLTAVVVVFAVVAISAVSVPRVHQIGGSQASLSVFSSIHCGWSFHRNRPGLMALLLLFALINFLVATVTVLATPLVLSMASPTALGALLSAAGVAMLAGSALVTAWGGPKRQIYAVLVPLAMDGAFMIWAGASPTVAGITCAAFGFFCTLPFVNSCSTTIWQTKVPRELQGRIFALIQMVAWSTVPLAYILAGPLADRVFEPAMRPNGLLSHALGGMLGVGKGRGIGLLFVTAGLLTIVISGLSLLYPRLRQVEAELPDEVPDAAAATFVPVGQGG